MEKRKFVPELGREVVYDDSYPPEYVEQYIQQQIGADAAARMPRQKTPQTFAPANEMKGFLSGIPAGVVNAIADIPEGLGGVLNSDTLKGYGRDVRESSLAKFFTDRPQEWQDTYGDMGGRITGNILSMLIPGGAIKAVGAPAMVGRAIAGTQATMQGAAEQVREAAKNRSEGMTVPADEETSAARWGAATGILGLLPYERFLRNITPAGLNIAKEAASRGAGKVAKDVAKTAMIEGGTEAVQQGLQNLIESGYNPNQELMEGVGPSAGAGGTAGAAIETALQMLARRTGKNVMARREKLPGRPLEAIDDASVGIWRGEGGDPVVEYLQKQTAPVPSEPNNITSLLDQITEIQEMSRAAQEEARIRQPLGKLADVRMTPEGTIEEPSKLAFPKKRERYVGGEEGPPIPTLEQRAEAKAMEAEMARPILDRVLEQPVGKPPVNIEAKTPGKPVPGEPAVLPDVRLTEEGTIAAPSNLAMDQPGAPRFSLDESGAEIESPYTIEGLRKEIEAGTKPKIALDVFGEMQRLGVDDLISSRLLDNITTKNGAKSEGSFQGKVIDLALAGRSKNDILRTLNHESVHAMKKMGLFSEPEWQILQASFTPGNSLADWERKEYNKLYGGRTDLIKEEAIARGIEKYAKGELEASPEAVGIASNLINNVQRIGSALRGQGFTSGNDVVKAFRSGEIGGRDVAITDGETNQPVNEKAKNFPAVERQTNLADIIAKDAEANQNEVVPAEVAPTEAATPEVPQSSLVPQLPVSGNSPFAKPDERGRFRKAWDEYLSPTPLGGAGLRARQDVLDMRAAIEEMSHKVGDTKAMTSGIAAVRNADVSPDFAVAALKYGPLEYKGTPGNGYFEVSDKQHIAPATVFREAYQAGKMDQLFHYLAAERGGELAKLGLEKRMSPQDIAAWKQYGNDPEIAGWASRWKQYNDSMVDALQKTGRLDAAEAQRWKKDLYLPFYRVEEDSDGNVKFQSSGATLASNPQVKKIKGGTEDIADPLANIARNANTLTSMAMKNEAMQRVMRDGIQMGVVKPVHEGGDAKVWVNGKQRHFKVEDPILLESITASRIDPGLVGTIASAPAKLLREAVTLAPPFWIRNGIRDATMAWSQGYTAVPMQRLVQDSIRAIRNAPDFQNMERLGVVSSGIRGEGGAPGTAKNLRELFEEKGGVLKWLEDQSRKSEASNRLTVYDSVMKRTGGDKAQAAYEARELLNFNRRGAAKWAQWLNAVVPFQNARWQGSDVLYRTLKGRGANEKMRGDLIRRSMYMTGLSAMYAMMAAGTKAWQNASPEERDNNWIIATEPEGEGVKIPIPFELGYFTKIVPERLVAMYMGTDTGKDFVQAFNRFLMNTLKLDPVPQGAAPVAEVAANYSRFKDASIEPEFMKKQEKSLRFDENTSELAKKIAKYAPDDTLSPLQIDHLLRGYLGTVGMYGVQLADFLANPQIDTDKDLHELPVVGTLFQRPDGPKKLIDFYELRDAAEQAANAMKKGAEPTEKRTRLATLDKQLDPMEREVTAMTKAERGIRDALKKNQLSPSQARATLKELRARKLQATEPIQEIRKEIP